MTDRKAKGIRYHHILTITNTGLSLGGSNMCIVHLSRELETGQGLSQVCLQWADHHEHEGLGVASERELQEIGEL